MSDVSTEVKSEESEAVSGAPCYFLTKGEECFSSKRDAEKFLAAKGGLAEGERLVRGKYLDVSEAKVYQIS